MSFGGGAPSATLVSENYQLEISGAISTWDYKTAENVFNSLQIDRGFFCSV